MFITCTQSVLYDILADRAAKQYDRPLASSCRLSVCNAVHCGSPGRGTELKMCTSRQVPICPFRHFVVVRIV